MTLNEFSALIQAIGSVGAILVAVRIAQNSERQRLMRSSKAAVLLAERVVDRLQSLHGALDAEAAKRNDLALRAERDLGSLRSALDQFPVTDLQPYQIGPFLRIADMCQFGLRTWSDAWFKENPERTVILRDKLSQCRETAKQSLDELTADQRRWRIKSV